MNSTLLYLFIIIAIAALSLTLWSYLRREVLVTGAKSAAKATRGILRRFGALRGYKVLSGVKLKDGDEEITIENMLVGYFGILLVRTLGVRGEYYGTLDAESWSLVANDKKTAIENPVKRLEREAAALRCVFAKNKIYNIPIETITYISNKSSKTAVYVTHSGEVLLGGKLSGHMQKSKFERDTGIDVNKIADAVLNSNSK